MSRTSGEEEQMCVSKKRDQTCITPVGLSLLPIGANTLWPTASLWLGKKRNWRAHFILHKSPTFWTTLSHVRSRDIDLPQKSQGLHEISSVLTSYYFSSRTYLLCLSSYFEASLPGICLYVLCLLSDALIGLSSSFDLDVTSEDHFSKVSLWLFYRQ